MTKRIFAGCLLAAITLSALGQRVLVKFSANNPDLPNGWPYETSNPLSTTNVPAGWSTNWTIAQVEARRASLQSEYQAIQDAKTLTLQTNRQAQLQALKALFDNFEIYNTGWINGSNYNATQMQLILRQHNEALVRMRPFLRDMYESRTQ